VFRWKHCGYLLNPATLIRRELRKIAESYCISDVSWAIVRIINTTHYVTPYCTNIWDSSDDKFSRNLDKLRKRISALLLSRSVTHPAIEIAVLPYTPALISHVRIATKCNIVVFHKLDRLHIELEYRQKSKAVVFRPYIWSPYPPRFERLRRD